MTKNPRCRDPSAERRPEIETCRQRRAHRLITMPIMLSESEGLGAAFATLVCFFLVTVAFAYTQRSKSYDADTYMVARNTQGMPHRARTPA